MTNASLSSRKAAGLEPAKRSGGAPESQIERKIIRHERRIIDALGAEPIAVYGYLASELDNGPVDKNLVFQFVFRSYYRLDNAGLTPLFKGRYFELLQQYRGAKNIDLRGLVEELRPFRNRQRLKTLQFSFATKLAATANANYPIYDSKIAKLFGFRWPSHLKTFEARLERCLVFYDWLRSTYRSLLITDRLRSTRAALEIRYPAAKRLHPVKALDLIFWSAGTLGIVAIDKFAAYAGQKGGDELEAKKERGGKVIVRLRNGHRRRRPRNNLRHS